MSWRGKISCGSTCSACTILTERLRKPIGSTAPKPSSWRFPPPTLRASCSNAECAWWDSDAGECWWAITLVCWLYLCVVVVVFQSTQLYFLVTGQSFVQASSRDAYWWCAWANAANYQAKQGLLLPVLWQGLFFPTCHVHSVLRGAVVVIIMYCLMIPACLCESLWLDKWIWWPDHCAGV